MAAYARTWSVPLALLIVAIMVRLPHLATIPAPSDETDELLWSWRIFHAGFRPLTASDPYLGPLANYLMALSYAVLGPSLAAGRLVNLVLGSLTAPATWLLARRLGATRDGAILAGLVPAVAFGLVVIGSHVAWSHGAAPLFTALALACLVSNTPATPMTAPSPDDQPSVHQASQAGRRTPARLGAAGCCAALAFAAHPTTLAILSGPAFIALWRGTSSRLGRGAAFLAGAALGYAPNLWFLAAGGWHAFLDSAGNRAYFGLHVADWPQGVVLWWSSLADNWLGIVATSRPPLSADAAGWLVAIALGTACLISSVLMAWRLRREHDATLLLAAIMPGGVIMPLLMDPDRFAGLTNLRYSAPALPALAALAALTWERVASRAGPAAAPSTSPTTRPSTSAAPSWRRPVAAALVLALFIGPLCTLAAFYHWTAAHSVTGEPVLAIVSGLASGVGERDLLLTDSRFDIKLGGGGEVGRAVEALLTLNGIAFTHAKTDKLRWYLEHANGARYDLVLTADTVADLSGAFDLTPKRVVKVVPGQVSRSGESWGWYRFGDGQHAEPATR